jgi:hypothetical protein
MAGMRRKPESYFKKTDAPGFLSAFRELLFAVPEASSKTLLIIKSLLVLFLAISAVRLLLVPIDDPQSQSSFMINAIHAANLVFHEAGHMIFRFFGEFVTVLGGTLMQLIVPAVFSIYFLFWRRDPYSSSVTFWWFGENFIDIAPYIFDAKDLNLILLGGHTGKEGFHDWEYILNTLGLIKHSHGIAWLSWGLGLLLMLMSFLWAALLLYKQYVRDRS